MLKLLELQRSIMETEYKNYFAEEVLNNNVVINKLKKT